MKFAFTVEAITLTLWVVVLVHPFVVILYWIVCVPTPAVVGENAVPLIPGPVNVPPVVVAVRLTVPLDVQ